MTAGEKLAKRKAELRKKIDELNCIDWSVLPKRTPEEQQRLDEKMRESMVISLESNPKKIRL